MLRIKEVAEIINNDDSITIFLDVDFEDLIYKIHSLDEKEYPKNAWGIFITINSENYWVELYSGHCEVANILTKNDEKNIINFIIDNLNDGVLICHKIK
jgi:hypothetical protein